MKPQYINLEVHKGMRRGNTAVLEEFPFKVKRIFTIYGVNPDEVRGKHAHKKCHQILISVCGAIYIEVSGRNYVLDCPDTALYVPPMNMIEMHFVDENSVLLVLASDKYDINDYVEEQ